VTRSADEYQGWGDAVIFEACTAARIGEVSGCLVRDISTDDWIWTVRRPTTPSPGGLTDGQTTSSAGGLVDKNTKGRRARQVPLIDAAIWFCDESIWPAATRTPDSSQAQEADASAPPRCATRPHGTKSSPDSATNT
jgi:hypothetical protein